MFNAMILLFLYNHSHSHQYMCCLSSVCAVCHQYVLFVISLCCLSPVCVVCAVCHQFVIRIIFVPNLETFFPDDQVKYRYTLHLYILLYGQRLR